MEVASTTDSPSERPSWDLVNCLIVWIISLLATCTRLNVGVLIWNPFTKQIVSVGYNGAPRGQPHCLDVGCEMEENHCVRALHGDTNALYWAGTNSRGCYMYLNYDPCRRCCNHIIQGGITRVVYTTPYKRNDGRNLQVLREAGIEVEEFGLDRLWHQFLTLGWRLYIMRG